MKLQAQADYWKKSMVAPRTGAWIETLYETWDISVRECRPPHGGVD